MYKRILVPFDGSETSSHALTAALNLARMAGGRLRIVNAFDEMVYLSGYEYAGDVLGTARGQAAQVLGDALARAQAAGVPAETSLLEAGGTRLGDAIAKEADGWDADLVVVGTHGRRGIGRALLGSGAEQIIRTSPVPVLSIRSQPEGHPK